MWRCVLVLLLPVLARCATDSPTCAHTLSAVESFFLPDGINSTRLSDFRFIRDHCNDALPISYVGSFEEDSSFELSYAQEVLSASLRRSVRASVREDVFVDLIAGVELVIVARVRIDDSAELQEVTLAGEVFFNLSGVPVAAQVAPVVRWQGFLETNDTSLVSFRDGDLFDGVLPLILLSEGAGGGVVDDVKVTQVVNDVLKVCGRVPMLLDVQNCISTSLSSSLRGTVLGCAALPIESSTILSGRINGSSDVGVMTQIHVLVDNPDVVVRAVSAILAEIAASNAELVVTSEQRMEVRCSLRMELFVSSSKIWVRAMFAESIAYDNFATGNASGWISLLSSAHFSNPQAWPREFYFGDLRTAVGFSQALPVSNRALAFGTIAESSGDALATVLPADLTSDSHGGLLVRDSRLDSDVVGRILSESARLAHTGFDFLDESIRAILPDDPTDLLNEYGKAAVIPTLLGFFNWYESKSSSFSIYASPSGSNFTIQLALDKIGQHSSLLDHAQCNAVLRSFYDQFGIRSRTVPTVEDASLAVRVDAGVRVGILVSDMWRESGPSIALSQLQKRASTSASLEFSGENRLLNTAVFSLSEFADGFWPVLVVELASDLQSSYGKYSGLDRNLRLPGVFSYSSSDVAGLLHQVGEAASALLPQYSWARALDPLVVDLSKIGGSDHGWNDVVGDMGKAVQPAGTVVAAWDLSVALASAAENSLASHGLSSKCEISIVPFSDRHSLNVGLNCSSFVRVAVSNTIDPNGGLFADRLFVDVLQQALLSLDVTPGDFHFDTFSVKLRGGLEGWSTRYNPGLVSGRVDWGYIAVDVDLPEQHALLDLRLICSTDLAGEFESTLSADLLRQDECQIAPNQALRARMVAPLALGSTFASVLLGIGKDIVSGALSTRLPVSPDGIGDIVSDAVGGSLDDGWLWMSRPVDTGNIVSVSREFCPEELSIPFNLSININRLSCMIMVRLNSPSSLSDAANQMTGILVEEVTKDLLPLQLAVEVYDNSSTDPRCGRLSVISGVSGGVWEAALYSFHADGRDAVFQSAWSVSKSPAFSHWNDFAWCLHLALDYFHFNITPRIELVPVEEVAGLVPVDLQKYYPPETRGIFVDLSLAFGVSANASLASKAVWSDHSLEIDVLGGANLTGSVSVAAFGEVGAIFDGPPPGNGQGLTLYTCVDNSTTTFVPAAPNNTFFFVVTAQNRSTTGAVDQLSFRENITLTTGVLLIDAFLTEFTGCIQNGTLLHMVRTALAPGQRALGSSDQASVVVSRWCTDDWCVIPMAVGFEGSLMNGIFNATNSPAAPRLVVRRLNAAVSVDLSSIVPEVSGTAGMFGIRADRTRASVNFSVDAWTKKDIVLVSDLVGPVVSVDRFFVPFEVQINASAAIDVGGVDLLVGSFAIPLGSDKESAIIFDFNGSWCFVDAPGYKNWTKSIGFGVDFHGNEQLIDLLRALVALNVSSSCSWAHLVVAAATEAMEVSPIGQTVLPFSSHSLKYLWEHVLLKKFLDIEERVCEANSSKADVFCLALSEAFGGSAKCVNISQEGLSIALNLHLLDWKMTFTDAFNLNLTLFDIESGKYPVGIGTEDSLVFHADASFDLQLVITFDYETKDFVFSFGNDTQFVLRAYAGAFGSLKAYLGPLSVTFATASVEIGSQNRPLTLRAAFDRSFGTASSQLALPVDLTLTGGANFSANLDLGSEKCEMSAGIPEMADFLEGKSHSVDWELCDRFLEKLEQAFLDSTLFRYFSDPSLFLRQFEGGILELLTGIFGPGGEFIGLIIPLLDKEIERVCSREILSLVGADVEREIYAELINKTHEIANTYDLTKVDRDFIDKLLVDFFTGMLCKIFSDRNLLLGPCPTPELNFSPRLEGRPKLDDSVSKEEFVLHFKLGRAFEEPISGLSFHLGDHGAASLDLTAGGEYNVSWSLQFALTYDLRHGIRVVFDRSPIFAAEFDLDLLADLFVRFMYAGGELNSARVKFGAKFQLVSLPNHPTESQRLLDGKRSFEFDAWAYLGGELEVGFAGLLKKQCKDAQDVLDMLPHWKCQLEAGWNVSIAEGHSGHTPLYFRLYNGLICVGTVIYRLLGSVMKELHKVVDPLMPVLKAEQGLRKPVHATHYIFGKDMTRLELAKFIYDTYCSGTCIFDGVFDMISSFDVVVDLLVLLDEFKLEDSDGCMAYKKFAAFAIDFKKEVLEPIFAETDELELGNDESQISFDPGFSGDRDKTTKIWRFYTTGEFGIKWYLLANKTAEYIIDLIIGKTFPIVGITIPKATFAVSHSWDFIVWTPPTVRIHVGIGGSISVDVGAVVLTSEGMIEAIKTKSVGKLLSSLSIPTLLDDGSKKRWQISGTWKLEGGVDVSIFIVHGGCNIFIEFDAGLRVLDPLGDGWCSFDQLFWMIRINGGGIGGLWRSMEKKIDLRAGFELYLKACIHIPCDGKDCWTIVDWKWSEPIFTWDFTPRLPQPPASAGGLINFGIFGDLLLEDGNSEKVFEIESDRVSFVERATDGPDHADPARVKKLTFADEIGYSGAPSSTVYSIVLKDVSSVLRFPHSPGGTLVVEQNALATTTRRSSTRSSVLLAESSVSRGKNVAAVLEGACAKIVLSEPIVGQAISVTGARCDIQIDSTQLTNVTLSGSPSRYGLSTISVAPDAFFVESSIESTMLTVSSSEIQGNDGYAILIPAETIPRVRVFSHPVIGSWLTIVDNPSQRDITFLGGSGDDFFIVSDLRKLSGLTTLYGGGGTNTLELVVKTDAERGLKFAANDHSAVMISPEKHALSYFSVPNRTFTIVGAPNQRSECVFTKVEDDGGVVVNIIGAPGGTVDCYVNECEPLGVVYIRINGSGTTNVWIGQNDMIASMRCAVRVYGSVEPDAVNRVTILSRKDQDNMDWDLKDNSVSASYTKGRDEFLRVVLRDVQSLHTQFSYKLNTVEMHSAGTPMEYVFDFPTNNSERSSIRVVANENPVLVVGGARKLWVGPKFRAEETSPDNPLEHIRGMVAVGASGPLVQVLLDSGKRKYGQPQGYRHGSLCLHYLEAQNESSAVVPLGTTASEWFIQMMKDLGGFPSQLEDCHIAYVGNISFSITTGDSDDFYEGIEVKAPVVGDLGGGDDTLIYSSIFAPGNFSCGPGQDNVTISSPISNNPGVVVDLGDDNDVDVLVLNPGTAPVPGQISNVFYPVGPLFASLTVEHWTFWDLISCTGLDGGGGGAVVPINNNQSTGTIERTVVSNTTYQVVALGDGTEYVFLAQNAYDWMVDIMLPRATLSIVIVVRCSRDTRGKVVFRVPGLLYESDNERKAIPDITLDTNRLLVKMLQIVMDNPDEVVISTLAAPNDLLLQVDSVPGNADLLVVQKESDTANLAALPTGHRVFVTGGEVLYPEDVFSLGGNVLCFGSSLSFHTSCRKQNVSIAGSCLNAIPKVKGIPSRPYSEYFKWFVETQSQGTFPPLEQALDCSLFQFHTGLMNISTPFVYAQALDAASTMSKLKVRSGSIHVDDTSRSTWASHAIVVSSCALELQELTPAPEPLIKFTLELDVDRQGQIRSPAYSSSTLLRIVSGGNTSDECVCDDRFVSWSISASADSASADLDSIEWTAFCSHGEIFAAENQLVATNVDAGSAVLHLRNCTGVWNVSIGTDTVIASSVSNERFVPYVQRPTREQQRSAGHGASQLGLHVHGGWSSVFVDVSPPLYEPHSIVVHGSARGKLQLKHNPTILLDPKTASVNADVLSVGQSDSSRSKGIRCFDPTKCGMAFWTDQAVLGTAQCASRAKLSECENRVVLEMQFDDGGSFRCDNCGTTAKDSVAPNSPERRLVFNDWRKQGYANGGVIVLCIAFCMGMATSVLSVTVSGKLFDFSLSLALLTAACWRVAATWGLHERVIVDSARLVCLNLFMGSHLCDDSGRLLEPSNVYAISIMSIAMILPAFAFLSYLFDNVVAPGSCLFAEAVGMREAFARFPSWWLRKRIGPLVRRFALSVSLFCFVPAAAAVCTRWWKGGVAVAFVTTWIAACIGDLIDGIPPAVLRRMLLRWGYVDAERLGSLIVVRNSKEREVAGGQRLFLCFDRGFFDILDRLHFGVFALAVAVVFLENSAGGIAETRGSEILFACVVVLLAVPVFAIHAAKTARDVTFLRPMTRRTGFEETEYNVDAGTAAPRTGGREGERGTEADGTGGGVGEDTPLVQHPPSDPSGEAVPAGDALETLRLDHKPLELSARDIICRWLFWGVALVLFVAMLVPFVVFAAMCADSKNAAAVAWIVCAVIWILCAFVQAATRFGRSFWNAVYVRWIMARDEPYRISDVRKKFPARIYFYLRGSIPSYEIPRDETWDKVTEIRPEDIGLLLGDHYRRSFGLLRVLRRLGPLERFDATGKRYWMLSEETRRQLRLEQVVYVALRLRILQGLPVPGAPEQVAQVHEAQMGPGLRPTMRTAPEGDEEILEEFSGRTESAAAGDAGDGGAAAGGVVPDAQEDAQGVRNRRYVRDHVDAAVLQFASRVICRSAGEPQNLSSWNDFLHEGQYASFLNNAKVQNEECLGIKLGPLIRDEMPGVALLRLFWMCKYCQDGAVAVPVDAAVQTDTDLEDTRRDAAVKPSAAADYRPKPAVVGSRQAWAPASNRR